MKARWEATIYLNGEEVMTRVPITDWEAAGHAASFFWRFNGLVGMIKMTVSVGDAVYQASRPRAIRRKVRRYTQDA